MIEIFWILLGTMEVGDSEQPTQISFRFFFLLQDIRNWDQQIFKLLLPEQAIPGVFPS